MCVPSPWCRGAGSRLGYSRSNPSPCLSVLLTWHAGVPGVRGGDLGLISFMSLQSHLLPRKAEGELGEGGFDTLEFKERMGIFLKGGHLQ